MSRADAVSTEVRAGVSLLERAVGYLLGVLPLVTDEELDADTPCRDWDLRLLLAHVQDSLDALNEAVDDGQVTVAPDPGSFAAPDAGAERAAGAVRESCRRLVAAWSRAGGGHEVIDVGGLRLSAAIVTGTGAIELAVHGWDIARACGAGRPLPPVLAEELLELAPLFVHPADRPGRFAPPLPVPEDAGVSERLLGFLGRRS
ncbi:hypothetical protein SRB5_58750 [Streptomyces sp. RB5]|uniref:Mycothiol-dependent maleylpyruvate isomerase metal-binding domain-containing protein n=1 Tax=Streptomyces smaragdinus TaxID=2585196 RepID=A0A7K0CQD0_9ACTN|nr:TIGR03086 family metal-binding protein [Streptomyces smaragdinus]MQY15687.1 hypothetical protein [Streptomyces smaragdinus]